MAGRPFLRLLFQRSLNGSQQVLLFHGLRYIGHRLGTGRPQAYLHIVAPCDDENLQRRAVATQCSVNSRLLRLSIAPLSRRYSQGYREVQPVVPGRWFASCPRSLPGILSSYFKVELYSSSLSLAWLAAWSSAAFALAILPVINCSIAA